MGWEDRPYYRDRSYQPTNPFMWLMTGSLSLGIWFGIDVRLHAWLILFIVLNLIFPGALGSFYMGAESMAILFGIVLLHEFGHCVGSRMVGGNPTQIIMHPLGGLASADAPHRAWPNFFTVLAGPLVNVAICILAAVGMGLMVGDWRVVPWNPAGMISYLLEHGLYSMPPVLRLLWLIFGTSYIILLFNLLPIFPLDGGQMLQSLVWVKFGYYRATIFATITGMIGGGLLALYGLSARSLAIILIAAWGVHTSWSLYRITKADGPWGHQDEDSPYAASLVGGERRTRRETARAARRSAKAARQAERLRREEAAEQAEIDEILAKVSAHGMQSLTGAEKKALQRATERQRARDAELTKLRRRG